MTKHEGEPPEGLLAKSVARGCLAGLILVTSYLSLPTVKHVYEQLRGHEAQPAPNPNELTATRLAEQIKTGHPQFDHMSTPVFDPESSSYTFTIPATGTMPEQDCHGQYTDQGTPSAQIDVTCRWDVKLAH